MNILITGSGGFIGFHTCLEFLKNKKKVIGIDNINNYYDVNLKKNRIKILKKYKNFTFKKIDITNKKIIENLFINNKISYVIHLAAQAGVRYSLSNPEAYFKSNIIGHYNLIYNSSKYKIKHFVFASSSSVYGNNKNYPLNETEMTDSPQSFYAASKKINEIMSYSFSNSYKLPSTSLRFFTVYGPYGRPDMFLFKLVDSILNNKIIHINNYGNHERDFTYIDDVVQSIYILLFLKPKNKNLFSNYNIGSNNPIKLKKFIKIVEGKLNKKANKKNIKLQQGDVIKTHSNNIKLVKKIKKNSFVDIEQGIKKFIDWYIKYYKIKI